MENLEDLLSDTDCESGPVGRAVAAGRNAYTFSSLGVGIVDEDPLEWVLPATGNTKFTAEAGEGAADTVSLADDDADGDMGQGFIGTSQRAGHDPWDISALCLGTGVMGKAAPGKGLSATAAAAARGRWPVDDLDGSGDEDLDFGDENDKGLASWRELDAALGKAGLGRFADDGEDMDWREDLAGTNVEVDDAIGAASDDDIMEELSPSRGRYVQPRLGWGEPWMHDKATDLTGAESEAGDMYEDDAPADGFQDGEDVLGEGGPGHADILGAASPAGAAGAESGTPGRAWASEEPWCFKLEKGGEGREDVIGLSTPTPPKALSSSRTPPSVAAADYSAQTTADCGASSEPCSEGGVPSLGSTPRSPQSDLRRGISEDELCAHSALVTGGGDSARNSARDSTKRIGWSPLSPPLAERLGESEEEHREEGGSLRTGASSGSRGQAQSASRASPSLRPPVEPDLSSQLDDLEPEENQKPAKPVLGSQLDEVLDPEEQPIKSRGYQLEKADLERVPPRSVAVPNSVDKRSDGATAVKVPAASAARSEDAGSQASTGNGRVAPRPFLKRGARMPRSELPGKNGAPATKPISNPIASAKPTLRLQPRSSSAPAVGRKAGESACPVGGSFGDRAVPFTPLPEVDPPMPAQRNQSAGTVEAGWGYAAQARQREHRAEATASPDYNEFADVDPWDCRGGDDFDLDLDLDETVPKKMAGDAPTSHLVQSYFGRASAPPAPAAPPQRADAAATTPSRHTHWEGSQAFATLYGRSATTAAAESSRGGPGEVASVGSRGTGEEATDAEVVNRLAALDREVKKYERENETLKKLRAQVEQSERDLERERQKLWSDVEAEKSALFSEFDAERKALQKEKRRVSQGAAAARQQLGEERGAQEERQRLQERLEGLEEEMREKDKRWQRTVDRLQKQVLEVTGKNRELQEEVRRASQLTQQAQQAPMESRRSSSASSTARGRRPIAPSAVASRYGTAPSVKATAPGVTAAAPLGIHAAPSSMGPTGGRARASTGSADGLSSMRRWGSTASSDLASDNFGHKETDLIAADGSLGPPLRERPGAVSTRDLVAPAVTITSAPTQEVREVRTLEGRTERIFADGRREVEFANGLRKVMWGDGRTSVLFQNGDAKEIHSDGVVVYHYKATGAVQTTLKDGTELYKFTDGQFERHNPDGSKEIRFPNGTSKQILADGGEEVVFADGTVRRSPVSSRLPTS